MLGQKRAERQQVRVNTEVRAALADFTSAMESRVSAEVERSRKTQLALIQALQRLRDDLDRRDDLVAHALSTVTLALDRVADRMVAEREQQRALAEVVADLADSVKARSVAQAVSVSERLLGGLEDRNGPDAPIADGDEVLCYLDGRWVEGFDVVAVVRDNGTTRYQLRRRSDNSVSDRLFDADEVRKAGNQQSARTLLRRLWSRV